MLKFVVCALLLRLSYHSSVVINSMSASCSQPAVHAQLFVCHQRDCDGIMLGGRALGPGDTEKSSGLYRKWVHHVLPEMKVGKIKSTYYSMGNVGMMQGVLSVL